MATRGNDTSSHELYLCDWERSVVNCKDPTFVKTTLAVCAILHLIAGTFGIWVLWYRNGSLNSSIVTNLYTMQQNSIRPRPIDRMAFFTTTACFLRILDIMFIVLDVMPLWVRVMLVQTYWWIAITIISATSMVGTLYALPVAKREGSFAVYMPQHYDTSNHKAPVYVFYPTPKQRDFVLLVSFSLPIITAIATGIASAIMEVQGKIGSMQVLIAVQYTAWGAIELLWACITIYYGLHVALLLRAHIIFTEPQDSIPPSAFKLTNLKSGSPARYLLGIVQIAVITRSVILGLAGSLANLRAWSGEDFLRPENETFAHLVAALWTCPITIAHFVQLGLIALHCSRNQAMTAHILGNSGPPTLDIADGRKLTLYFQTNATWSQTSHTFDQVLSELASVAFSAENPREPSTRLEDNLRDSFKRSEDAQVEVEIGDEDEDLKNRVARSVIAPSSDDEDETQVPAMPTLASSSSSRALEPEPQLQEFRMLQLQHQSSLQRIQTLRSNQQRRRKPMEAEQFSALQSHLQEVQQSLEQLQHFYNQLQPLSVPQAQDGKSARLDPVERMRAHHLRSSMSILQRHLKFTLRQLNYQIETCQSNLVS